MKLLPYPGHDTNTSSRFPITYKDNFCKMKFKQPRKFLNGEGGSEYAGDGPIGGERRPPPQAPSAPVLVRRVSPPAASFRMSEVKKWSSSTSGEIWPLLREPPRAELTAVAPPIAEPTAWPPPPALSLNTAEDRTA